MTLTLQFFFFLLTLAGVGVIVSTKNVIHAVYALALILVSLAGIYVLLNAELLAIVQILLYAGGVVILLVFGVMMTKRSNGNKPTSESRNSILALVLSLVVFSLFVYLFSNASFEAVSAGVTVDQIKEIGVSFLTDHIVAFELIAFVLLVALVGASYLAKMSSNE